jgi:hypothetical protein
VVGNPDRDCFSRKSRISGFSSSVAPIDGKEYAAHRGTKAVHAGSDVKECKAARDDESVVKRRKI